MGAYVTIDLWDLNSTRKSLAKLGTLDRAIERAISDAIDEVMEWAYNRMLVEMSSFPTMNGTLLSSNLAQTLSKRRFTNGFEIEVSGEYGLYVEFGTGIVGKENPHPSKYDFGGEYGLSDYDSGGYGHVGWYYFDADGKRQWTKGMPARPFMYNTYLYIRRMMTRTVNKHINRVVNA